MATTIFRQVDFPRYLPGIYATLGSQILLLALLAITSTHFWLENKRIRGENVLATGKGLFLYTL